LQNRIEPLTGFLEPEALRLTRCLAEDLGHIDVDDPAAWNLHLTGDEHAMAARALAPLHGIEFVAINMGGKDAQKDWGEANWHALLTELARDMGHMGLVLIGASVDHPRAESMKGDWPSVVLNLCGALSPRESAAALTRARLFIGHDSGPLHLSAALGIPSLGLFGDFNRPRKWHPIGTNVLVIHEMRGIDAILVGDVTTAAKKLVAHSETVGRSMAQP
jgi:ADP-heptose:LPS heptosyltransferase